MNISLKSKVSLVVALIIGAIGTFSTFYFTAAHKRTIEQEMIARGKALSISLAKAAEEGVATEDLDLIKRAAYIVTSEDVTLAQVFTSLWQAIDAFPSEKYFEPPAPEAIVYFKESDTPFFKKIGEIYDFYCPVMFHTPENSQGVTIGFVRLTLSSLPMQQTIEKVVVTNSAISVLIAFLALFAINVLIDRLVITPVVKLHHSVKMLKSGTPVPFYAGSAALEIRELSEEFTNMSRAIGDREEKLQQERDRAQRYLDIAGVIFMVVDGDRKVSLINKKGAEVLGSDESAILGRDWFATFVPDRIRGELESTFGLLVAREIEMIEDVEYPVTTKSGAERFIAWHRTLLIGENNTVTGILHSGEDVTERNLAREKLERLNAALEDKNRELEQIVYVTSHDLRSPLVNIYGFSKELEQAFTFIQETLADGESVPNAVREKIAPVINKDIPEAFRFIYTGTAKMDLLLSGLLTLSRLGRAAVNFRELDMNALISEVIKSFEFQIKKAGIEICLGTLPPCLGDEMQINQVFSNLVDNAIKYLDPKRNGLITIGGEADGASSLYFIEDNGIGIPREQQENVFKMFHRLSQSGIKGEGLGLSIVKTIIKKHEGKVWVESEFGRGSRFYIALPNEFKAEMKNKTGNGL